MNFRNAREKGRNSLTLELVGDNSLVPRHRLQRIPTAGLGESQPSSLICELRGTTHSFALWVTFTGNALKLVARRYSLNAGEHSGDEPVRRVFVFAIRCKKPNFLVNFDSACIKRFYFLAGDTELD